MKKTFNNDENKFKLEWLLNLGNGVLGQTFLPNEGQEMNCSTAPFKLIGNKAIERIDKNRNTRFYVYFGDLMIDQMSTFKSK